MNSKPVTRSKVTTAASNFLIKTFNVTIASLRFEEVSGDGNMAQGIKVLAAKTDNLSLIPGTYMEEESLSCK